MSDVLSRVKKMVVEHLDVEEDKVTDKANFIDDLGDRGWCKGPVSVLGY